LQHVLPMPLVGELHLLPEPPEALGRAAVEPHFELPNVPGIGPARINNEKLIKPACERVARAEEQAAVSPLIGNALRLDAVEHADQHALLPLDVEGLARIQLSFEFDSIVKYGERLLEKLRFHRRLPSGRRAGAATW